MTRARAAVAPALAVFLLVALWSAGAWAAAAVELATDPQSPAAGEWFRVRYVVHIRNESGVEATPLDFGGLEVEGDRSPPTMQMMMWGGGAGFLMSADIPRDYVVRAPAPGRYTIGNARVVDARTGRVIAQHPGLTLQIAAMPSVTPGDAGNVAYAPPPPQDPDQPPEGDLTGAEYNPTAFIRVALDTPNPYLGQQVVLRAWLYVATSRVECEVTRELPLAGFWSEPLLPLSQECAARWFVNNVHGRNMAVGLVRKIAMFPAQAGRLNIGRMVIGADVAMGGPFGSVMRVEARSPDLQIDVREPPAAGRPANYVPGTTGPVTLATEADRTELAVGETATITLRATSAGSLASATIEPPRNLDGVRVQRGTTRGTHNTTGGRVLSSLAAELLVVPERPGNFDLGEVELPYWDPVAERYGVARARLPALRATGEALRADANEQRADPSLALRGFVDRPSLRAYHPLFARTGWALALLATPPLALAAAGLVAALRRRAVADAHARADERRTDPRAILDEARSVQSRDGAAAISLAGRALDRALAAARADLGGSLDALSAEARATVDDARAACESARFAGEAADAGALLARVERAVAALEAAT